MSPRAVPRVLIAFLAAVAPSPSPGQGCAASMFGPLTADPLVISGAWNIQTSCNLDFGHRHVILSGATLTGPGVAMQAGKLTIDAQSSIANLISLDVLADAQHDGSLAIAGTVSILSPVMVIHATGDVSVSGAINGYPWSPFGFGAWVCVFSDAGNITVTGQVTAVGGAAPAGNVLLAAARDVLVAGPVTSGAGTGGEPATVEFDAGRMVTVSNATVLGSPVIVNGCRVSLFPGSVLQSPAAAGSPGQITVTAGDLLTLGGSLAADPGPPPAPGAPTITLKTRLASPYSPIVMAGATFSPAPAIVHDNTLAPCLARLTASLTGSSSVALGGTAQASLASVPQAPVLAVVALAPDHLFLGALGWTQVDVFHGLKIADPGLFGVIPGSSTDAAGLWNWSQVVPSLPALAGMTVRIEAFVVDPNALNGFFHQPPALDVTLY